MHVLKPYKVPDIYIPFNLQYGYQCVRALFADENAIIIIYIQPAQ